MPIPLHIREALERDAQRQEMSAYEVENNLVSYTRKVVAEVAKLGSDQEFDESQLTILERDLRQFVKAYHKCTRDAVVTREYLRQNPIPDNDST